MKVFYLKGLSTTVKEFEYIYSKFSYGDVELVSLVDNYADLSKLSKEKIIEYLKEKINASGEENINLICHSMGCNFGLILASNMDNINNVIFVSPEFENVTKEEQSQIEPSSRQSAYVSENMPMSLSKLKSILLFMKSKKWVNEEMTNFINKNIKTSILYSKGDKFVSRKIIHKLSEQENINEYEIDTNNHNPLLEDVGCVDIIIDRLSLSKSNSK